MSRDNLLQMPSFSLHRRSDAVRSPVVASMPEFTWVDPLGRRVSRDAQDARKAIKPLPLGLDPSACVLQDQTIALPDMDGVVDLTALYAAQSGTGRAALQTIAHNDILLGYRHDLYRETRMQAYFADDKIIFDPLVGPALLNQILVEEVQHALEEGALAISPGHSLRSGIMLDRAREASGKTRRVLHVEQCLMAQRKDPRRFVPPEAVDRLEKAIPAMAAAGREARPLLETGRTDLFLQAVFRSYYDEEDHLAKYDRALIEFYEMNIPHLRTIRNEQASALYFDGHKTFMGDDGVDHVYIAGRLKIDGINYLQDSPFSLDDEPFTRLSAQPDVTQALSDLSQTLAEDEGYSYIETTMGKNRRPVLTTERLQLPSPPVGGLKLVRRPGP